MALAPLATVADLEARGVTVALEEETAVTEFLRSASDEIRDAAGCAITQTTGTVQLVGHRGAGLRLPGPPITAVSAVSIDGEPITDYALMGSMLYRREGWKGPSVVSVTYTHGLPEIPADIVDLTCRLAARALVAYRSDPASGLAERQTIQERIGDFSHMFSSSEGEFSNVTLPPRERQKLAARFGNNAAAVGML